MHQGQKVEISKKLLKVIFRVVTLYASESLKAQSLYPDVYYWFEKCNKVLESDVRNFLHEKAKKNFLDINLGNFSPSIDMSLSEEDIIFIFSQYYWDYYQHEVFDYNKALFKELGLMKQDVDNFIYKTGVKLKYKFNFSEIRKIKFIKKYHLSGFVGKDRFIRVVFQYFKLLYLIESENELFDGEKCLTDFFKLIKEIPYYSIISRSSIVEFKTYPTRMGKRYFSKLQLPMDVQPEALADNIIHFIFQYISETLYFTQLREEPCNFDILRFHREFNFYDFGMIEDLDFSAKDSEHYHRLDGCILIVENLLKSLPQNQRQIFTNSKNEVSEIAPLLLSILFANSIRKFDLEVASFREDSDLTEAYALPIRSTSKKIKNFLPFLEREFKGRGLDVQSFYTGNADECLLYIMQGKKILMTISGKNIKDNFKNHRKFFIN